MPAARGASLHDALMERCGWPAIPYDGELLVSHQDALLIGGKVQAPPGYADHVVFLYPVAVRGLRHQALRRDLFGRGDHAGPGRRARIRSREMRALRRLPLELRDARGRQPDKTNIDFRAGAGGLHSAEN